MRRVCWEASCVGSAYFTQVQLQVGGVMLGWFPQVVRLAACQPVFLSHDVLCLSACLPLCFFRLAAILLGPEGSLTCAPLLMIASLA